MVLIDEDLNLNGSSDSDSCSHGDSRWFRIDISEGFREYALINWRVRSRGEGCVRRRSSMMGKICAL
ncbi:hypothetical protein TanjilG_09449 [Lupinus angustifolius]|uniref:Uncharacterized protein n=1 Tax=Lupinus angustifolius TaxID=3871 RepID=A0A4P1RWN3_LUPAN|nr:hypothetical protein TanjilG_09449 [Lupinus angustifolius]